MAIDRHPEALVSTAWLAAHLDDPDLRIFECTTYLRPVEPDAGVPYRPEAGVPTTRQATSREPAF